MKPFRSIVEWAKRLILETVAEELSEQASQGTGYTVAPPAIDHGKTPAIEYQEAE